jgi:DNA-binding MarR family transcriptional regulator
VIQRFADYLLVTLHFVGVRYTVHTLNSSGPQPVSAARFPSVYLPPPVFLPSQEGFSMPKSQQAHEISLLEAVKAQPDGGQRDLAEAVGLSLGLTNMLLKNLAGKGWMKVRRLSPGKMQYLLTPEGVRELSQRSYRYVTKTIHDVATCRQHLEVLVVAAQAGGAPGLCLVGASELGFVLEHLCLRHGFPFRTSVGEPKADGWYYVYGEGEPSSRPNVVEFLSMRSS